MKTDNNGTVLYNRSELQAVFSQLQPREEYSLLHFNVKKGIEERTVSAVYRRG